MHNIIAQRNVFIDTESMNFGDGSQWRISIPPAPFAIKANQRMKLSLMSFQTRKNWYDINQTNNTFFFCLHTPSGDQLYPCIIPPGTYNFGGINGNASVGNNPAFTTNQSTSKPIFPSYTNGNSGVTYNLCDAIAFAVQTTLLTVLNGGYIYDYLGNQTNSNLYSNNAGLFNAPFYVGVTYSQQTRKFTIQIPQMKLSNYTADFCFIQMKKDVTQAFGGFNPFQNKDQSTYGNWSFQDSHLILGGTPTRDNTYNNSGNSNNFVAGLTVDSTKQYFTSVFVAQLSTLDNLYLRLHSSNTSNYESPNFERDLTNVTTMTPSPIIASIAVSAGGFPSIYAASYEQINFLDSGNELYSTYIDSKYLESLTLSITDSKSRPISDVAANESKLGVLSYKMTLRWSVEQLEFSASSAPASIDIQNTISPVGFVSPLLGMNNFTSSNTVYQKQAKTSFNPVNGNRIAGQ